MAHGQQVKSLEALYTRVHVSDKQLFFHATPEQLTASRMVLCELGHSNGLGYKSRGFRYTVYTDRGMLDPLKTPSTYNML